MKIIIYVLLLACVANSYAQNMNSVMQRKIFENPPDSIPKIFAKDIISVQNRYEYGLAISPTWEKIFFTAEESGDGLMVMRKLADGNWTKPEVANLRQNKSWEFEAFYPKEVDKLYFTSIVSDTSCIWVSCKYKNNWLAPQFLKSPVNSTPVFWTTFSHNNNMYYTNLSKGKIYCSEYNNGSYLETYDIKLSFGMHPYISADESYILFNGKGDLYITFKEDSDKWTNPVLLSNPISTSEYIESCPTLSPDEKYIFFSRYNDVNEKSDIYWVDASIIDKIKKQVFN